MSLRRWALVGAMIVTVLWAINLYVDRSGDPVMPEGGSGAVVAIAWSTWLNAADRVALERRMRGYIDDAEGRHTLGLFGLRKKARRPRHLKSVK